MMKTTLVIMAAGIGSRYGGGIKQLATVGPNREILMDYSVFDALRAGFDRIVFVIRKDIEADFRSIIGDRIAAVCDVSYVFQERDDVPSGFSCPEGRTKPWGTGQAILACKGTVQEPFAVINADDFYGPKSYSLIHRYLTEGRHTAQEIEDICLAGYILENTLSENGGVTRGICRTDPSNKLLSIHETKEIHREKDGTILAPVKGQPTVLSADCQVSMNMWGLTPSFFDRLEEGFTEFLSALHPQDMTSEFLLPIFIDSLIAKGKASCTLLPTDDKWFGLTYKEDLPAVRRSINQRILEGEYPEHLMENIKK